MVQRAKELELDVTGLLKSHDKTKTDEEWLLMDEQRKCFLEMECIPGEDTKIVEMTTKNLECYRNNKVVRGFEEIDSFWGKLPCCLILRICLSHTNL